MPLLIKKKLPQYLKSQNTISFMKLGYCLFSLQAKVILKMSFKSSAFIICIISVLIQVRGENCSLPEIITIEGEPQINQPTLPDAHGYYSFKSKNISIVLLCRSNDPIQWIYTAEETHVTELHVGIFKLREKPNYRISSFMAFRNGSGYGDFYCLKTVNPCGMQTIKINSASTTNLSTFQITHSTNVVPPSPSNPSSTAPCPLQMEVKIDYSRRTMEARCIPADSHTNQHLNIDIKFKDFVKPIELYANLRQGVLPGKCVRYVDATEKCTGCIPFEGFTFKATLIKCFTGNYKHFVFFPLDSFFGNASAIKYHHWNDVDFTQMIRIDVPSKYEVKYIPDNTRATVRCTFSNILFLQDWTLPLGFRFNGTLRWNEIEPSSVISDENENYNMVSEYEFTATEFNQLVEINCQARMFNSTKIVNVTRTIRNGLEPPTFRSKQDIVEYKIGVALILNCTAFSDLNVTYKWILPMTADQTHLQPNIMTTSDMSSLIFPPMSEAYAGSYFCTASNNLGNVIKEFLVQSPNSSEQSTNGIWTNLLWSFGFIILILALIFVILLVKMRKQNEDYQLNELIFTEKSSNISVNIKNNTIWRSSQPWLKLSSAEPLGRGSFAVVYKVMNLILKEEFALKRVNLYESLRILNGDLQSVLREIRNLSAINDLHVVRMFHCWIEDEQGELEEGRISRQTFQDWSSTRESFLFITMELCDFTLQHWLEQHDDIESRIDDIPQLIHNCISGLSALHMKQIIHRDIKPNNIFCNVSCSSAIPEIWKLGDLGLSTNTEGIDRTLTVIGCRDYRSPEMQKTECKYNFKTDVFSLGLTFLESVYPFIEKLEKYESFEKLRSNKTSTSVLELFKIDKECQTLCKLIDRMLCVDPHDRIDITGPEVKEFLEIIPVP